MSSKGVGGGVNYGIQSRNVKAEVVAVGKHARAAKVSFTGPSNRDLAVALEELAAALRAATLPEATQTLLKGDISAIEKEAQKQEPRKERIKQHLQSLAEKVKMAREMAGDVAGLIEPISKIAAAVGLGVGALSLF